jgi:putative polyketide hydroxylase
MELFRAVELQAAIEEVARDAWKMGGFGGARRGQTMLSSEAADLNHLKMKVGGDPSPCRMTACPQTLIEPLLRGALEQRGGDARFGHELLCFEQDSGGVHAIIRDAAGRESRIDAEYMFAADGGRSEVRRRLGIKRHGLDADRHYLNIHFTCDLASDLVGRTFSQCEVENEAVSGTFAAMNNTTEWCFHLRYDPATVAPEVCSDAELERLLHVAIGTERPITIHHRSPWNTRIRVADRYRDGRVYLMGDAAHAMAPFGGMNANTGIQDAHNLAWKVAQAWRGDTNPDLLDSYDAERIPVAERNAFQSRLRTDFDARFGIRTVANAELFAEMIDYDEAQMRYRYGDDDTVSVLQGQPGTRFPHAWINHQGERRSTLDLVGPSHVALGGPASEPMSDKSCYRAGIDFHFMEDGVTWSGLTGRPDDAVIHLRPDGFVAPT